MIYPTARAALIAGGGGIFCLAIAAAAPDLWAGGFVVIAFTIGLLAADAALSPWPSAVSVRLQAPAVLGAGRSDAASAEVFANGRALPSDVRLETNELIDVAAHEDGYTFRLTPNRRGQGEIKKVWVRWRGPLGLIDKQYAKTVDAEAVISSDTRLIEKDAINILTSDNLFGVKTQIDRGEGSEFDSLREFQAGMDSRTIDWKQTARHRTLLSREFRTEKNHSIVFAIDTGRLMCEPVGNGLSRLDHALNAALLMSFVSLKLGDRVGFFAFDAKPSLKTGIVSGASAFAILKKLTAGIDYTHEETNFTLGLTELSATLHRRSLIIVFSDFADSTSAELMLANLSPLMKRHLILFVAFRDEELESLAAAQPANADDVTRAVIADTLMQEREIVLTKLQRMGALIVDAPSDRIGAGLINQYLNIKRRNLL